MSNSDLIKAQIAEYEKQRDAARAALDGYEGHWTGRAALANAVENYGQQAQKLRNQLRELSSED